MAWAVGDDDTRKQIEAAFDASTEAVISYLQRYAVASRGGGAGGTERVEALDHQPEQTSNTINDTSRQQAETQNKQPA